MPNCSIECENAPHCECFWSRREGLPHGYHCTEDLLHPQIMEYLEEMYYQDKMEKRSRRSIAMYRSHQRRKSRPR